MNIIRSFKSRALKRFWEREDARRLPSQLLGRISLILDRLETAEQPSDMAVSGLSLHSSRGDRSGEFAVFVSHNWRITFRWDDGDAVEVDFLDYH